MLNMLKAVLLGLLFTSNVWAFGGCEISKVKNEKQYKVYDGDTFYAEVKCGDLFYIWRVGVRLAGVDTPEIKGKTVCEKELAREAKKYTQGAINGATIVELKNAKMGKYFRVVGDVVYDGRSLSEGLIKNGLGVAYDGGKKGNVDWCKMLNKVN